MMRNILVLLALMIGIGAMGQNVQTGYVKTKGRLGDDGKVIAGTRLSGVTVVLKDGNSVLTDENGEFTLTVSDKKFYLQNVKKAGYVLADPDVLSKQYVCSEYPLVIVLETPIEQSEEILAMKRKIRRTLTLRLQQKEDEIAELKEQNRITQEERNALLQKLYADQDSKENLISEMAEQYSRVDYDQIDDFNRRVNDYILNGELTKADSLLNSQGDINSKILKIRQILEANAQEETELSKRMENLNKSKSYAKLEIEDAGQWCHSKYEIFKMQYQNDSAAYYLELRASLDTLNIDWQTEVGNFESDNQAKYDLAMSYYQKALNTALKLYGEQHHTTAMCYRNIGSIYREQGNYSKSLEYQLKALDIRTKIYGEQHLEVAKSYNDIGLVYYNESDYSKAMEYYMKSFDIVSKIYGEEHNDIAVTYSNISAVYMVKGEYNKALEYTFKALDVWTKIYGEKNPYISSIYNKLGNIYIEQGEYPKALEYFHKILDEEKKVYGENHPTISACYNNIGRIYCEIGGLTKALEYYFKALEIVKGIHGEEHPTVALLYNNIGSSYYVLKEYDKSLEYNKKALDIRLRIYGENHPYVADSYNGLGVINSQAENYAEALEYHQKSLNIQLSIYGEKHPSVARSYTNIGTVFYKKGDYAKSLEYRQKALKIWISVYGEVHPIVAICYEHNGLSYKALGDEAKSEECNQKAKDIRAKLEKQFDIK